jgi:hypothetical protein
MIGRTPGPILAEATRYRQESTYLLDRGNHAYPISPCFRRWPQAEQERRKNRQGKEMKTPVH